jgi:hypothetical protein
MSAMRAIGLVLLAGGVALLVIGLIATGSIGEQAKQAVTGRFTETTTWYIVGGIAAAVAGAAMALMGKPART